MEIGALDEKIPISNTAPSIVEVIENIPKKGILKKRKQMMVIILCI